jgi:hypothetical protein
MFPTSDSHYLYWRYSYWEWLICTVLAVVSVIVGCQTTNLRFWLPLVCGGVFAATSGTVITIPALHFMRWRAKLPFPKPVSVTADVLGYIERILVFGACVLGHGPAVIAGWVLLKTISQWKAWDDEAKPQNKAGPQNEEGPGNGTEPKNKPQPDRPWGSGRARFNVFLAGDSAVNYGRGCRGDVRTVDALDRRFFFNVLCDAG